MKSSYTLFLFLALASCTPHYTPAQYRFTEQKITVHDSRDEKMWNEILPYKDSLDKEMNVVLAVSDTILTKSTPESDLGNFMCDLILKKSRNYFTQPVDFTIMNNGGIRLPNLPKGNITLGDITELMPFENRVVLMSVSGKTVDSLFNHMAANGGWQVSGARYAINKFPKSGGEPVAVNISIGNEPLNLNKNYSLAISDYLAQGGDNCKMLVGIPYTDSKKTIREALVEGLKEMTIRGEHVKSILDGRVQIQK